MTRTSLNGVLWTALMLTMQRIGRTGAPWRDLPNDPGRWPSVHHRCLRRCARPGLPDGLVLLNSTTCSAKRCAFAHGRSRGGLCSMHACADGAGRVLRLMPRRGQH